MRRLVQTSGRSAVLDLDRYLGHGFHLRSTRFGPDGWEDGDRTWFAQPEMMKTPQTLEQFLATELGVPGNEALALAREILSSWVQEWESRGGKEETRAVNRLFRIFVAGLAVLIAFALLGVALLVWMLVS